MTDDTNDFQGRGPDDGPVRIWEGIHVWFQNYSSFQIEQSESDPPVFNNAELTQTVPVFSNNGKSQKLAHLKRVDSKIAEATACLTYTFGKPAQKLVAWIWIAPDYNLADIKVAIIPSDKSVDATFLDALTPKTIDDDQSDFHAEGQFDLSFDDAVHNVAVAGRINYQMIPVDRDDFYSAEDPSCTFAIRDAAFKPEVNEESGGAFFKIAAGHNQIWGQPIHENMTLAALIAAGIIPRGRTYKDTITWDHDNYEWLRGVIWNDDPSCSLFNDEAEHNASFGQGVEFFQEFKFKKGGEDDKIISRSHFEDLQFLHSMGCEKLEPAELTKSKILTWLEVMYKLSIRQDLTDETLIRDTKLRTWFNQNTRPRDSDTLKRLLTGRTSQYNHVMLDRRALGSCFHTIQDSYAVGHCQRALENPKDKIVTKMSVQLLDAIKQQAKSLGSIFISGNLNTPLYVQHRRWGFPLDSPGRFRDVSNFHCYEGQDEDKHGAYDEVVDPDVLDASNPGTFRELPGAVDAIDVCEWLAEHWKRKTRWEDGVGRDFETGIYKLTNATPSNVEVDEPLGPLPPDPTASITLGDMINNTTDKDKFEFLKKFGIIS